jgi:serine/threonine protein phosphatase PrpC
VRYSALSDIGLKREKNEDSWNIVLNSQGDAIGFIIADGMGGHFAGEEASRIAVEEMSSTILEYITNHINLKLFQDFVLENIYKINERIIDYSNKNLGGLESGTTLSAGVVMNNYMNIVHIGDCRVYLVRDSKIELLTQDHSYVAELVKGGFISSDEANRHPERNRITRALGFRENFLPDFYTMPMKSGDIYIFCTDGLYEGVDDKEILDIVNAGSYETLSKRLVEKAKECGGSDNITVIAAWM